MLLACLSLSPLSCLPASRFCSPRAALVLRCRSACLSLLLHALMRWSRCAGHRRCVQRGTRRALWHPKVCRIPADPLLDASCAVVSSSLRKKAYDPACPPLLDGNEGFFMTDQSNLSNFIRGNRRPRETLPVCPLPPAQAATQARSTPRRNSAGYRHRILPRAADQQGKNRT